MEEQLVEQLKAYLDPEKEWNAAEEKQLTLLLRFAGSKILSRRYPFDHSRTEVPPRYHNLQIRAAAELYAKLGAEGQVSHNENGIARVWESSDVAPSLLDEVVPLVGVP